MNWTDYTTKTALKDNDELMILDKDANANKRTLMDKVWDYVVDKMTTAVIAKLGTTDKTLIGAVNELNSNKLEPLKLSDLNSAPLGFSIIHWNKNNKNTPLSDGVTSASEGVIFSFTQGYDWGCQFSIVPGGTYVYCRYKSMEWMKWNIK